MDDFWRRPQSILFISLSVVFLALILIYMFLYNSFSPFIVAIFVAGLIFSVALAAFWPAITTVSVPGTSGSMEVDPSSYGQTRRVDSPSDEERSNEDDEPERATED